MNRNEPSGAMVGRNPRSDQAMPSFTKNEVSEAAIWIEGEKYIPKKSYPSIAGVAPDKAVTGLNIHSDLERLSALIVHGDAWEHSRYEVKDSTIELSGYGVSDFTSRGAGALIYGGGQLALDNVDITTRGSGRSCTIATEQGTLFVKNSRLASYGGPLPADYEPVIGPGMMEPPWPLGLDGNCRTHLSMDGSRTFFDHCELFGQAWAVLSTDSSGGCLWLEATDCKIVMAGNGYDTYADNGCYNCFTRCEFSSGNMLSIQDGNNALLLTDCKAECGRNVFVIHGALPESMDASILKVDGGSYKAVDNVIYAKSATADIHVRGANLYAEKGCILRSVCNDDPIYYERAPKGMEYYGVQATFEDMEMNGSIAHEDTDRRMRVSLENSRLNGAVTGNPVLNFFGNSSWFATADSEVTIEEISVADAIDAAEGVVIAVHSGNNCPLVGEQRLASGGILKVI